jgi:hypothetical protein
MAGFNEILSGRFNRALQKLFSMKGPASVNELATTVQPNVQFSWGTEMRYLEAWNRFGASTQVGPTAAVVNAFQIHNPTTTGIVAVIEKFSIFPGAGVTDTFVVLRTGPQNDGTELANILVNTTMRFDARTGTQGGSCILSSQAAAAPGVIGSPKLIAPIQTNGGPPFSDVIITDDQQITLLPGDAVQVIGGTVNIAWFVSVWWRERPLEDSEKR